MANVAGYPSAVISGIPGKSGKIQGGKTFSPADIADLFMWYDASQGVTVETGVSVWADQSGNGFDLLSTAGVAQPAYITNQAKPFIRFDGSNDALSVIGGTAQPFTIFFMHRRNAADTGTYILFNSINGRIDQVGNDQYAVLFGVLALYNVTLEAPPVFRTMLNVVNGVNSLCFDNGGSSLFSGDLGSNAITQIFMGFRLNIFKEFDIGELIIYDRVLNNDEIDEVGNYLASKYAGFGLTWTDI